jgi:hypothetical protein
MTDPHAHHVVMITECIACFSRLTRWERDFINNQNSYLTGGGFLTPKVIRRLTIIHKKVK